MKLACGVVAIFAILFLAFWLSNEAPVSVKFNAEDVISGLPKSDTTDCVVELGDFVPAPDVLVPHAEGALGSYGGERFLVSGFSHYLQKHLLTSPRVDRRPAGQEEWVPIPQQAPTSASHIQAAIQGSMLWIAGGFVGDSPGKATEDVWRYDMVNDFWHEGPKLPRSRASGGFVAHAGELHYISGLETDRDTGIFEHLSLDPALPDGWKVVASFPRARNHFQAVSLGGFIYAVGGMKGHDKTPLDVAHLDVYHPEHGQWLPMADLPETRSHAELATFVYRDRIIVVGGRTNSNPRRPLDSIIEYNPYKDEWQQIGSIPRGLYGGYAFVENGRIYVGGGGRIWKEPSNKSWSAPIRLVCD